MNKQVTISNWKELKEQFGTVPTDSLVSAVEMSRTLKTKAGEKHVAIDCNKKSEAVACFTLKEETEKEFVYEYNGTAN